LKIDYVQNPHRMFYKVNYDDANLTMEDVVKIDYEKYTNAYVKVVVLNKQNPYLFDHLLDRIYKAGPVDVAIVEDFSATVEEDDEIINQAEDTMTVLSKYIDTQSLNISDTNKLKTLMRELYVEALSQENIE
jgi:5'(3')-deoxyribonucleotidase